MRRHLSLFVTPAEKLFAERVRFARLGLAEGWVGAPPLRGKMIVNLFFESSTRTRISSRIWP